MVNSVPGDSVPPAGSGPNQPTQGAPPAGSAAPSGKSILSEGGGTGRSLTWLGMTFDPEQTKQLFNIMIQNIGAQIQKYNDKGVKAIKNYEKVSEGKDPDD